MAQTYPQGTPEWWRETLSKRLDERAPRLATLQAYYDGRHPLAFASRRFREAFGGLFDAFADNFCPLVVDAVEERLNVEGFRWGGIMAPGRTTRTETLAQADADAWRIWQSNQLDAESQKAHTTALTLGEADVIVWADPDPGKPPRITIESPREVYVALKPGEPRVRQAALKRWLDDDDRLHAFVYLPDAIYKWRSTTEYRDGLAMAGVTWEQLDTPGEPWPLPNPLGVVPVVPLPNRPKLSGVGESELQQVIPAQDAINKTAMDMLIASEFAAYRQRYALNLLVPTDDSGRPTQPWNLGADRLLVVPPPEDYQQGDPLPSFGEFDVSDLRPYVAAIELWVQHIATRTRTPAHYMLGQSGSFPSGESLKATETGLVAKVHRAMRHYGEGWEEVMRLAFAVAGDASKAKVPDAETIWGDPESRSEAEHVDAITKMASLGVPQVVLWEELGFTPTQIARMEALKEAEAMTAAASFDPFAGLGNGQGAGLGPQQPAPANPPPAQPANGGAPLPPPPSPNAPLA